MGWLNNFEKFGHCELNDKFKSHKVYASPKIVQFKSRKINFVN